MKFTDYDEKACYENICFGIDEFFLNHNLINYLISKQKPFLFTYTFNINSVLYFKYEDQRRK